MTRQDDDRVKFLLADLASKLLVNFLICFAFRFFFVEVEGVRWRFLANQKMHIESTSVPKVSRTILATYLAIELRQTATGPFSLLVFFVITATGIRIPHHDNFVLFIAGIFVLVVV